MPTAVSPVAVETLGRAVARSPNRGLGQSGPDVWFGYLNGSTLRKECGTKEADTYRFVYNADFQHQVRTYDLSIPTEANRPAILVSRVITHGGASQDPDLGPFSYQSSIWAQRTIGRGLANTVLQALSKSGFGGPLQSRASLRSDSFYWVVSACVGGHFQMSAWTDLSPGAVTPAFAQELFSLDETAVPIRAPQSRVGAVSFWDQLFGPRQPAKARPGATFRVELINGQASIAR